MSFYKSDDYKCSGAIELEDDELLGSVLVPGQLVFADLDEPGSAGEEYAAKYSATFRLPKDAVIPAREGTYAGLLFAVVDYVGEKTWKSESKAKMAAVWDCIDKGVAPRNSNINIQDGDLHNPEYNRGSWQVKASRRTDEGPVPVFDADGDPTEAGAESYPRRGDYGFFAIDVWAQKKRDRINFTLAGVQFVQRGSLRVGGSDLKKLSAKFAGTKSLGLGFAKAIPAEVDEPKAKTTKAVAKPVAKKGVFRAKK